MRFPEWLYKLLSGDQGTQQLGVIWREATSSLASITVSADPYVVPNDKCLVLTNACLRLQAGAAQTVARRRLLADPPAGATRYNIVDNEVDSGAGGAVTDTWQGEVVIPGGWKVRVEGTFSAGAAANEVNAEIHGYLIPRGSFIFG